jgi:hypothetical protein
LKLLWLWLCDRCDHAGIIEPSLKLASFHIGYQYPIDTLSAFGDRIEEIGCGKYLLTKFIQFQYGTISRDCMAHKPVFASLEKHKVEFSERVSKGYPKGINTLKDKNKDKDKDKDKDKSRRFQRPTAPEVAEYGMTLTPPFTDASNFVDFYESKGWKVGKEPMKDWKAAVRTWNRKNAASASPQKQRTFTSSQVGI